MAHIILPDRWKKQPTGLYSINWSHPSAHRLEWAFNAATLHRDIVTGRRFTGGMGDHDWSVTRWGRNWGDNWYGSTRPAREGMARPISGPQTMMAFGSDEAIYTGTTGHYCLVTDQPGYNLLRITSFTSGPGNLKFGARQVYTDTEVLATATGVTLGREQFAAWGCVTSSYTRIGYKGQTWDGAAPAGLNFSSAYKIWPAYRHDTPAGVTLAFWWQRELSPAEAFAILNEPFQLFRRDPARTYFFPPQRPEKKPAILLGIRRPKISLRHAWALNQSLGITTTGSITTRGRSLVLVTVSLYYGGTIGSATAVTGLGATFREVGNVTFNSGFKRIQVFAGWVEQAATGTLSITYTGNRTWHGVSIEEASGADRLSVNAATGSRGSGTETTVELTKLRKRAGDAAFAAAWTWNSYANTSSDPTAVKVFDGSGVTDQPDVFLIPRTRPYHSFTSTSDTAGAVVLELLQATPRPAATFFYPKPMQPRRVWTRAPGRWNRQPL